MNAAVWFVSCSALVTSGVVLGYLMWGQDAAHLRADLAAAGDYIDRLRAERNTACDIACEQSLRALDAEIALQHWQETHAADRRLREVVGTSLFGPVRLGVVDGGKP